MKSFIEASLMAQAWQITYTSLLPNDSFKDMKQNSQCCGQWGRKSCDELWQLAAWVGRLNGY